MSGDWSVVVTAPVAAAVEVLLAALELAELTAPLLKRAAPASAATNPTRNFVGFMVFIIGILSSSGSFVQR
jgi:hypothetical protein